MSRQMKRHAAATLVLANVTGGCALTSPDMSSMQDTRTAKSLYTPTGASDRAYLYGCTDNRHYLYFIPSASPTHFSVGDSTFWR